MLGTHSLTSSKAWYRNHFPHGDHNHKTRSEGDSRRLPKGTAQKKSAAALGRDVQPAQVREEEPQLEQGERWDSQVRRGDDEGPKHLLRFESPCWAEPAKRASKE